MDTRNSTLSTVAILVFVAAWSSPVFAVLSYTYGGPFDLPIPANPSETKGPMANAVIEIDDHFTVLDLDVAISLTHTKVFDLQLFLQSPLGTRLCLNMYDTGKEFIVYQNYTNTIFDDEAEIPIEQAHPPFTGRFRPKAIDEQNLLSIFDDEQINGSWQLQIYDMWAADTGNLSSFQLIVTVPEPNTAILLILGTALITLLKHPRRH